MKNILVLTDFSDVADNAAEYAVKFAAGLNANVILFHAVKVSEATLVSSINEEALDKDEYCTKEALVKLEILSKKLQIALKEETNHKPHLSFFAQAGNVKDCLNKIVLDHKVDLIIIGARQYNDFPGFLFGTNIKELVDKASCLILLVHQHTLYRPIKSIFYVTDLRYSDFKVLTAITNFAALLKSNVSMLHVRTDGLPALLNKEASAIFLDTIASGISYKYLTYYDNKGIDTQSAIKSIIKKQGMDVLAIANKKYHFLNHLFRKNSEKDTAIYAQIPILIIPDN